jgi:hypothetical protein
VTWTGDDTVVPFPGELKLMLWENAAAAKSVTAATQRDRLFRAERTFVIEEPADKLSERKGLLT